MSFISKAIMIYRKKKKKKRYLSNFDIVEISLLANLNYLLNNL